MANVTASDSPSPPPTGPAHADRTERPGGAEGPDAKKPAPGSKAVIHRLIQSVVFVLILALPGIIAGVVWSSEAAAPLLLGAIVGAVAAMSAGQKIALFQSFLLLLAAPVAIVAGEVPIAGAAIMALLCLGAGMTALWGMHTSFTMIPLVLAYPLIHPPHLGEIPIDRTSTAYVGVLSLLLFGGALWMALVVPILAKHRRLLALQPASRADALTYTIVITVLCSANTFAVLVVRPSSQGAWLILTLIAVTQLGPLLSLRRSVYRVVGTVLGALIAAGIGAAVPDHGLQILLALLTLTIALFMRSGGNYWIYVTFLTPTVVLLSSTGDVTATSEYRLMYTLIAVSQVLLASAIVFGYQHLRSTGRAQPRPLTPEPLAAAPAAE